MIGILFVALVAQFIFLMGVLVWWTFEHTKLGSLVVEKIDKDLRGKR